jgi:4-amino-4-deoxy-L-arabinose transferase-like glycosyltransferase
LAGRTATAGLAAASSWRPALLVTLAVAAALRFAGLGSGLWFDEIATLVKSARLPLQQILTEFPGVNAHPLFSVLAHASLEAFGESAWALRLPAAIFGVVSVAMVYVLGARLTSRAEAWAGAALLATSYHHIWFSQNARGYTLLGALTLLSTLFLIRAADAGRPRDYVLYALACAAGVYTHLTMAFVVAGQALVLLVGWAIRWRPAMKRPLVPLLWAWFGTALLCAMAYAPFVGGLIEYMNTGAPSQPDHTATASWALNEALRQILSGAGVPAAVAGGLLSLAGALSLWRRQPFAVALLVAPGAVTVLALAALGNPMRPRFVFFLTGAAAIFAGRGFGLLAAALVRRFRPQAPQTPAVIVLALLCASASAVGLPRNYRVPKQDFAGAVRYLDGAAAQGVRIAAAGPACFPLRAYYDRSSWTCLETLVDWRHAKPAPPARFLIVHTLTDYVEDPALEAELRTNCPEVARFPGTLGGGDIIVCEPARSLSSETGRP